MKKITYIKIIGGIGNQLFQYAAGLSKVKRNGGKLILDISLFKNYKLHNFYLDKFSIPELKIIKKNIFFLIIERLVKKLKIKNDYFYFENSNLFNEDFYDPKYKYHYGYFQSYRYLEEIKHHLYKYYLPKQKLTSKNNKLLKRIKQDESVMLHVRRGDYITDQKTFNNHGVCSITYYKKAISFLIKKNPKLVFYLFTNDPKWVLENICKKFKIKWILIDNITQPEIDLFLMSNCKYFIIANSTFSWWSAYLSQSKKIVIAPKPWFNNKKLEEKCELIPSDWKQISK